MRAFRVYVVTTGTQLWPRYEQPRTALPRPAGRVWGEAALTPLYCTELNCAATAPLPPAQGLGPAACMHTCMPSRRMHARMYGGAPPWTAVLRATY